MPRTLSTSRRTVPLAAVGALTALALTAWSCGGSAGTTGYSDPVTTTKTNSAIIDATTLAKWTDEGKVNAPLGTADRVIVVSATTAANFASTTKKHIPDAVRLDYPNELTMTREEGLGPATVMVLSGPRMEALVQKLGIDGSTTVVLTVPRGSTDSEAYQLSVAYFTFRYWGFSRERVKILNGGDDAWDVAGRALTDALLVPTPSTFKISGNKALKDVVRTSVGEMLTFVDSVNKDRSILNTWQMLDVRGFATSPYIANTYRGSGGFQFVTDRVNGEATRNRLYPDRTTLVSRMATSPVLDGAAQTFLSPGKKMLVMCGTSTSASPTFVLFDAVLGVPEGDVTMYDGSSSQWNQYSLAKIQAAGTTGELVTGLALVSSPLFRVAPEWYISIVEGLFGSRASMLTALIAVGLAWIVVFLVYGIFGFRTYLGGEILRKEIVLDRDDLQWLIIRVKTILRLTDAPLPPQGNYNAGQKLFAQSVYLMIPVIMLSGLVMAFRLFGSEAVGWAVVLHFGAVGVVVAGLIIHFYMGSVFPEEKPAFFSMITGNVNELHVYRHHFKWWREVKLAEREWAKTRESVAPSDDDGPSSAAGASEWPTPA